MKSSRKRKSEAQFYRPAREALLELFKPKDCYLEITADRRLGEKIKRVLTDYDLFANQVERFIPDITGYVIRSEHDKPIIVAEVKAGPPSLRDIFQTKQYAEIFGAKYAFLLSPEDIHEEIARIVKMKSMILSHSAGYERVFVGRLDVEGTSIVQWYMGAPYLT